MFGKLYAGELKKICRPKSLIALTVVLVVVLVVTAILYNVLSNFELFFGGFEMEGYYSTEENEEDVDSFSLEECVGQYNYYKDEYNRSVEKSKTEEQGYLYTPEVYSNQAMCTMLDYVRNNNLFSGKVYFLGYNDPTSNELSAETFTSEFMSIAVVIMSIFGIVIGAGLMADEYKSGTIKLLLSRPITQNQLISAKLLALLTVSLGYFGVFSLFALIYGLIAFPSFAGETLYMVFNATTVIKSSVWGYMVALVITNMLRIATYILVALAVGTLCKKKTAGILIGLLVYIGILSTVLTLTPVPIGLLSSNLNFMCYFSAWGCTVPNYGNFYISIGVFVAYLILFAVLLYVPANKRDVI